MMNANSHSGTLRYPLIMYTILFTCVAHLILEQEIELVIITWNLLIVPKKRLKVPKKMIRVTQVGQKRMTQVL